MLSMFANIATVVFFIALYVYIAAEVMMGGGSAAAMAWKVAGPSLAAAGGFRVLAWLFAPRASASRRRIPIRARR